MDAVTGTINKIIRGTIMDIDETAQCLAELGHPTRLRVFRYLVKMGHRGVPVGEIQEELDVPGSTLSHHLAHLSRADLISQTRSGRILHCTPRFDRLQGILDFLVAECCEGDACMTTTTCCK